MILEEIGDLFEAQGLFNEAVLSFMTCRKVDP